MRMRMSGERGAAAVEFAIVGSLLFMILFGTIQFGLAYNRYQGLNAAAREGARLGSLSATTKDEIITRVGQSVSIIAPAAVATNPCPGTVTSGNGCTDVFIRQANGSLVAAGSNPCNLNSGKTVVVRAKFGMQVPIPLWANPLIVITGNGEFRCE